MAISETWCCDCGFAVLDYSLLRREKPENVAASVDSLRKELIELTSKAVDCSGCPICQAKAAAEAAAAASSSDESYSE